MALLQYEPPPEGAAPVLLSAWPPARPPPPKSPPGSAATGASKPSTTSSDVTYGEDASQIRTGGGPQVMATLRNPGIAILKPGGYPSVAARVLATLGISPA